MLKNSFRALIVVTAFAAPCMSFGANLYSGASVTNAAASSVVDPGMPSPDPVFKKGKLTDPGMPSPDPVFKNGKLTDPGMPSPDPVFKKGK